jgi:hypothetical protein
MAADNLLYATNSMRSSVSSLKKKLSNIRVQLETFDLEIEKIESKFDNVLTQADIFKAKVEREMGREVRRLERELSLLSKESKQASSSVETNAVDLKVASSIGILEAILRHMCGNADDFWLASQAFLFPAVYERIMEGSEEAYYLEEVPAAAQLVINRGQEHIAWLRSEYDTHLTDPSAWEDSIQYIVEWWRNDALPLIYGARDEQWDIDIPLTLQEITLWKESPADRPMHFHKIFDAYEIYRKHKDQIYETSGLRSFELKLFTFEATGAA